MPNTTVLKFVVSKHKHAIMRTVVYTLILSLILNHATAQSITNGGFELWAVDSSGAEMPVGWSSDFTATTCIDKVTAAASDSFALRLMSRQQGFEGWMFGFITTRAEAAGTSGMFTCKIAVDTLEHGTEDS